jgi:alkylated DNA repair dioxygenase AlkB
VSRPVQSKQNELSPNGWIDYFPRALSTARADQLFEILLRGLDWAERSIMLYGREVLQPRLVAFYGDPGEAYRYSGKTLKAAGWPKALVEIGHQVDQLAGHEFNCVLCNLYRDGNDSMGWHADDEPELGEEPVIASVSLGGERRFVLKRRRDGERHEMKPAHGSVLIMRGQLQQHWVHQVPRTRKSVDARINLTFRKILDRRR